MSDTIKPRQDNHNAAWTPKVSDRLQEQVDALMADNIRLQNEVVGPLRERVRALEDALLKAIVQNEHDMLMTGEELRAARAALGDKNG